MTRVNAEHHPIAESVRRHTATPNPSTSQAPRARGGAEAQRPSPGTATSGSRGAAMSRAVSGASPAPAQSPVNLFSFSGGLQPLASGGGVAVAASMQSPADGGVQPFHALEATPTTAPTPATDPADPPPSEPPLYGSEEQEMIFLFARNFDVMDGAKSGGQDGEVWTGDLEHIVDHPEDFDDEVVRVAEYLLAHEELLQRLDTGDDPDQGTDGHIWRSDLVGVILEQTPPAGLDAEQQAAFYGTQLDAIAGAVDFYQLSLEDALTLVDEVLAGAPAGEAAFVEALDWEPFNVEGSVARPALMAAILDRATEGMSPAELDSVFADLAPQLAEAYSRAVELYYHDGGDAVSLFHRSLTSLSERAGQAGVDLLAGVVTETLTALAGDEQSAVLHRDVLTALEQDLNPALQPAPGVGMRFTGALLRSLMESGNVDAATDLALTARGAIGWMVEYEYAEYARYAEWLGLAEQHRQLYASDAEFEAARDELMRAEFGSNWEQDFAAVQARLAENGEAVLQLLESLRAVDPDSESFAQASALVDELLDDDYVAAAIEAALHENPELVSGERGEELLDFFSSVSLTGKGASVARKFANLYVESFLSEGLEGLRAGDVASADLLIERLGELGDDRLASILGLTDAAKLDEAIEILQDPELVERLISGDQALAASALEDLDERLDGIRDFSVAGRIFRGVGFAISAVALVDRLGELAGDPGIENALGTLAAAAGLVQSGADFARVMGVIDDTGLLARYGSSTTAARALGTASALFELWNAGGALRDYFFGEGDLIDAGRGGLHVASAGGMLLTSFASGGVAVLGIGITVGAGLLLNHLDNVEYSNRFQNDSFQAFLLASMLDDDAAAVLHDTSGEAYSAVPLLLLYGQNNGLSVGETIDWINGLDKGDLESIRDRAHEVADSVDGDLSALDGESDPDDLAFLRELVEARDNGVRVQHQGNHFWIDRDGDGVRDHGETRTITPGSFEELTALLEAKALPSL